MDEAKAKVLAFPPFPKPHWRRISSTNPLERSTRKSSAAAASWESCPNAAVIRLVGAALIDMHDEWIAGDRRYLSEESMALLNTTMDCGEHAAIESGEWGTEDHLGVHTRLPHLCQLRWRRTRHYRGSHQPPANDRHAANCHALINSQRQQAD